MSIQIINTGTSANAGNGDSIRLAFTKVNQNFDYLNGIVLGTSTNFNSGVRDVVKPMFLHDRHVGITALYNSINDQIVLSLTSSSIVTLDSLTVKNTSTFKTIRVTSTATLNDVIMTGTVSMGVIQGFDDVNIIKFATDGSLNFRLRNTYGLGSSEINILDQVSGSFNIVHQNSGANNGPFRAGQNYIYDDSGRAINIGQRSNINFYANSGWTSYTTPEVAITNTGTVVINSTLTVTKNFFTVDGKRIEITGTSMLINGVPVTGGSGTLSGLTDVTLTSPTNGQILAYNSSSGKWVNTVTSLARLTSGTSALILASDGALVLNQEGAYDGSQVQGTLFRIDTSQPNYTQMTLQNKDGGNTATSDIIFIRDDGDVTTGAGVLDIGINSSNYTEPSPYGLHTAGSAYMFSNDADLIIGTQSPGKRLIFHAGGSDSTDSALVLDGFAWRFNRNVQVVVPTPGPLNFTVWNTQNNSAAQAMYQAVNDASEFLQMGINSSNPGAAYGAIGPREGFVHVDGSTATLHIGGTGDLVFWSDEPNGGYETGTTATLVMSRLDRSSTFGGHVLPTSDLTYDLGSTSSQWRSLYVGTSTVYFGGIPLSVTADGGIVVNNVPVVAGTSTTVQPYIELTNQPLIVQTATLGEPVTITVPPQGINATFDVVIGAGPVIESVTVNQPGSGYSVNQIYEIPYFNIGGGDVNSSIIVTVADVDGSGGITTVTSVAFVGTATNSPGTYNNVYTDYRPSTFDAIDTGLTLTRDNVRGLFNSVSETEYNNNTYVSPLGTEWNSDGWGTLTDLRSRSYSNLRSALNNAIGENIVGAELVMHDTINDKYYKFSFSAWGQNNGQYAYTRNLITDPNFFQKTNYGSEVDIFVADDIGITRDNNGGIYNPYREGSWDSDVSPGGTLWNVDGWDDLSNLTTRTYQNFYAAFGNGGLGNKVPGSKTVMYIPDTDQYYAIEWINWTQNGNGGGFSYNRYLIDRTKVNEGVKFADGTVLKSAEGVGRVKSTASGGRRIEEAVGSKTVSVTQRVTTNLTTVASRAGNNTQQIWIDSTTTTIDDILNNPQNYGNAYDFEFSLNDVTWYAWNGSTSFSGTERGYGISPSSTTYLQGDTVYFRYKTGGESVVWWDKADLPGGSANFRGAVIEYHAYSGEATWIGTIHIVSDSGYDFITHSEVNSGTSDAENDDLWLVTQEGQIRYRRIDGEAKTLKVHWIAKVFYGTEFYD